METKFTKGKWKAEFNERWWEIHSIDGDFSKYISDTCASSCRGDLEAGEANAHLMAAALDMYYEIEKDINELIDFIKTLKCNSDDFIFYNNKLNIKQNLLAKARGEQL